MSGTSKPRRSPGARHKTITAIQLALIVLSVVFVSLFVAEQYGLIRSFVRFLCVSCIGLSD